MILIENLTNEAETLRNQVIELRACNSSDEEKISRLEARISEIMKQLKVLREATRSNVLVD